MIVKENWKRSTAKGNCLHGCNFDSLGSQKSYYNCYGNMQRTLSNFFYETFKIKLMIKWLLTIHCMGNNNIPCY